MRPWPSERDLGVARVVARGQSTVRFRLGPEQLIAALYKRMRTRIVPRPTLLIRTELQFLRVFGRM